jgi:hypothetical protein
MDFKVVMIFVGGNHHPWTWTHGNAISNALSAKRSPKVFFWNKAKDLSFSFNKKKSLEVQQAKIWPRGQIKVKIYSRGNTILTNFALARFQRATSHLIFWTNILEAEIEFWNTQAFCFFQIFHDTNIAMEAMVFLDCRCLWATSIHQCSTFRILPLEVGSTSCKASQSFTFDESRTVKWHLYKRWAAVSSTWLQSLHNHPKSSPGQDRYRHMHPRELPHSFQRASNLWISRRWQRSTIDGFGEPNLAGGLSNRPRELAPPEELATKGLLNFDLGIWNYKHARVYPSISSLGCRRATSLGKQPAAVTME